MATLVEQPEVLVSQFFNSKNGGSGGGLFRSLPHGRDDEPGYAGTSDSLVRLRFAHLAATWKRAIRFESSLARIVTHQAYQAIIGMGVAAIPLILSDLKREGGHWFWALHAITQADPAREGDDYESIRSAWLGWGVANGYL